MQQIDTYHLKTKKQAARYLNVSVASIERLMRSGLRYVKCGGLVRFRDEDLSAYLDQNTRSGAAA
jgi:excisionase family DNA binding protein